jgi:hypothetical protein
MSRGKLSLGNNRFVQVLEWRGNVMVDFREWNPTEDSFIPTKKGIRLSLLQYKNLLAGLKDAVDPALSKNEDDKFHVGANVFLSVRKDNPCVDLRQYWKPPNADDKGPTKKGLCMRPSEYATLKSILSDIETLIPELENVVPCYLQDDHQNQLGMLGCRYCNPDDYQNW